MISMKKWLFRFAPWVLALLILAWVMQTVSVEDAVAAIQQLRWSQIMLLIMLNGLILIFLTGRWWIILRGHGQRIPFFSLFGYRMATFGVSYFTPGPHMGGEPLQVYFLEKEHGTPRPKALAALSLDKTLELLVNFAFLTVGIILIFRQRTLGDVVSIEAAGLAAVLLLIPLFYLLAIWAGKTPLTWLAATLLKLPLISSIPTWQTRLQRVVIAIQAGEQETTIFCRQAPRSLVLAFFMSIIGFLLMIGEFWLMVSFLGIPLTLLQLITALTAARIAILLLLPGAIGVLEASQALAFGTMGLNPAIGISASLLIRLRDVFVGIIGIWWGSKKMTGIKNLNQTEGGKIL